MVEIAPGEIARPQRVIGLVEGQFDAADQRELRRSASARHTPNATAASRAIRNAPHRLRTRPAAPRARAGSASRRSRRRAAAAATARRGGRPARRRRAPAPASSRSPARPRPRRRAPRAGRRGGRRAGRRRTAASRSRARRRRRAGRSSVAPASSSRTASANMSRPPRRMRQSSRKRGVDARLAMGETAEHRRLHDHQRRRPRRPRPPGGGAAARRRTAASPAAPRPAQAPALDLEPQLRRARARRRRDRSSRPTGSSPARARPAAATSSTRAWSPPAMPPPVLTSTASHSAPARGKRNRKPPVSNTRAASVRAPARAKAARTSAARARQPARRRIVRRRERQVRHPSSRAPVALSDIANLRAECCPKSTASRDRSNRIRPVARICYGMAWISKSAPQRRCRRRVAISFAPRLCRARARRPGRRRAASACDFHLVSDRRRADRIRRRCSIRRASLVERLSAAFSSPIVLIGLAALAWAALSILWTPFSVPAGQHVLKIGAGRSRSRSRST